MPKLSDDVWEDVRGDYEAGLSVNAIAKRYGVARQVVNRKAERKGWLRGMDVDDAIDTGARAKADGVDLEADEETIAGQVDNAAGDRAKLIQSHREQWGIIAPTRDLLGKAFDPTWAPDGITPKDWSMPERMRFASHISRIFYTSVNSLLVAQEGERRAHGFDYKVQQKSEDGSTEADHRRKELLERLQTALKRIPPVVEAAS